jgi:hypothetical protein
MDDKIDLLLVKHADTGAMLPQRKTINVRSDATERRVIAQLPPLPTAKQRRPAVEPAIRAIRKMRAPAEASQHFNPLTCLREFFEASSEIEASDSNGKVQASTDAIPAARGR